MAAPFIRRVNYPAFFKRERLSYEQDMSTFHPPTVINRLHHLGKNEHFIISIMLRDFGMMMIQLFVPIILLASGWSVQSVALFFTLGSLLRVSFHMVNPWLYRIFGMHHIIAASYFVGVLYIVSLNYIDSGVGGFMAAAILFALSNTLFWTARHIDTLSVVKGERSARKLSYLGIASTLLAISAPFIGGLIAEYASPQFLYVFVLGIMVAATMSIMNELSYERHHIAKSFRVHRVFTRRDYLGYFSNACMNFQTQTSGAVWPMFIFFSVSNFGTLGAIFAFSSLLVMAQYYLVGKSIHSLRFLYLGTVMRSTSLLVMPFANSLGAAISTDLYNSAGRGFLNVAYNEHYYHAAEHSANRSAYIFMTELFGEIAKLIMWAILAISAGLLANDPFVPLFVIAAILSLGTVMIGKASQRA